MAKAITQSCKLTRGEQSRTTEVVLQAKYYIVLEKKTSRMVRTCLESGWSTSEISIGQQNKIKKRPLERLKIR